MTKRKNKKKKEWGYVLVFSGPGLVSMCVGPWWDSDEAHRFLDTITKVDASGIKKVTAPAPHGLESWEFVMLNSPREWQRKRRALSKFVAE